MLLLVIALLLESTFEAFVVLQIMFWKFEQARSVQIANYNAITFYIPIGVLLCVFLIITLRQSRSTFSSVLLNQLKMITFIYSTKDNFINHKKPISAFKQQVYRGLEPQDIPTFTTHVDFTFRHR